MCVCVCACVCACVRACVRECVCVCMCVRARVRACVRVSVSVSVCVCRTLWCLMYSYLLPSSTVLRVRFERITNCSTGYCSRRCYRPQLFTTSGITRYVYPDNDSEYENYRSSHLKTLGKVAKGVSTYCLPGESATGTPIALQRGSPDA